MLSSVCENVIWADVCICDNKEMALIPFHAPAMNTNGLATSRAPEVPYFSATTGGGESWKPTLSCTTSRILADGNKLLASTHDTHTAPPHGLPAFVQLTRVVMMSAIPTGVILLQLSHMPELHIIPLNGLITIVVRRDSRTDRMLVD